ncbi:MAG: hypothetical protein AAGF11_12405 [Myxococcota bacterium]
MFEKFANPKSLFVPKGPPLPYPGSETADIEEIFQAGSGNEILVDQNGEVVYYANHLNLQFWNFIDKSKFWDLQELEAVKPGQDLDFPVDSLEIKSSWRVAKRENEWLIPNAEERFYLVETEIPEVDEGGNVKEDKAQATMALVGLHVVGVVKGHHEFIWGTFEHLDNAPNCDALESKNPVTGQDWSFYDGRATKQQCNQFDPGRPMRPANVCRVQPQGGGKDKNRENIRNLNEQAHELTRNTIWANYEYVGAIWTDGKIPLNNPFPNELRGSLALANTTIETFKQDENCFSCHNASERYVTAGNKPVKIKGKHLNLSHFVVNYQASRLADN